MSASGWVNFGKQQVFNLSLNYYDLIPSKWIGWVPVYKIYIITAHDHISTALLYEGWYNIYGAI